MVPIRKSTAEAVGRFDSGLVDLQRRDGQGKAALTFDELQTLVRADQDAAHDFVLVRCVMARTAPKSFQIAFLVAKAYESETGDTGLAKFVLQQAQQQGAQQVLDRISIMEQG